MFTNVIPIICIHHVIISQYNRWTHTDGWITIDGSEVCKTNCLYKTEESNFIGQSVVNYLKDKVEKCQNSPKHFWFSDSL